MMTIRSPSTLSSSRNFSFLRSSSINRLSSSSRSPVFVKSVFVSTMNITSWTLPSISKSKSTNESLFPPPSSGYSFFRGVLLSMEQAYLNRNPTAESVLHLVRSTDDNPVYYDHIAYRTFGIDGHGIDSISKFFLDFGYTQRDELSFPKKKLKALWFSPPDEPVVKGGFGVFGPLPRIFISELLVDQMSPQAQEIIKKYVGLSGQGHKHAVLSSAIGHLPWPRPSHSEFQQLASESEYAAWTLVNGYIVNHVTVSAHKLKCRLKDIQSLNKFIEIQGFSMNSEGGVLKVSPDGLLLQSSTVADSMQFEFSDGVKAKVPCSYVEFAERLVLPEYKKLSEHMVEEIHRREGFEVDNADKIFESTSTNQLNRRVA
ncbi:hypothetical protein L1887_15300 [Cichorium endivia]|nr:hypothetical protein L1887_15300 [Cichorium endivia]